MKRFVILLFVLLSVQLLPTQAQASEKQKNTVKILSYNVRNCKGLDNVIDYSRVATIISRINADFVAIQELDSVTERNNKVDALNELAKRTQMFPSYRASISYQGGKYGIGILTREKPIRTESCSLPGKEEKRSLLIVEMKDYVICCTHLSLTREDRISSVEIITQMTAKYSKPVFLAGDMNAEPNSVEINNLSKNWTILSNPAQFTIPADRPDKCIDFIMLKNNDKIQVKVVNGKVENEPVASDHLPVWTEVVVTQKE